MDQGLIPKRYAKAIYEVAQANGTQKELYQKMQLLSAAFAAEPKLNATLNNPFVADADKVALLLAAAQTTDKDAQMGKIIALLQANGRIGLMREIAAAYEKIYRQANKIYRVEVTSAAHMYPEQEQKLKDTILQHLNGGSMEYSHRVDPDLIGGFVVNIDNERLDASIKNELKQLRLKLLSN